MSKTINIWPESPFFTPVVRRGINFRVSRLAKKYALGAEDRKDLRQEFVMALHRAEQRYDPAKCPQDRYVQMVLNHCYKYLVRELARADKSDVGHPISIEDLDCDVVLSIVDPRPQADFNQVDLEHDVGAVMAKLSQKERRLCRLLMEMTPAQAARRLDVCHSDVYLAIRRLRPVFTRACLSPGF